MKRFLSCFLLTVVFVYGAFAQSTVIDNNAPQTQSKYDLPSQVSLFDGTVMSDKNTKPGIQAIQVIENTERGFFTYYSETSPIVYDPSSDMIFIASPEFLSDAQGNLTGCKVWVNYKPVNGGTWMRKELYEGQNEVITNPSLGVLNPTGGKNVNEMNFIAYGSYFPAPDYMRSGGAFIFVNSAESDIYQVTNPVSGYTFSWMKAGGYQYEDEGRVYLMGLLGNTPNVTQYGLYGYANVLFDSDNEYDIDNILPDVFGLDYFRETDNTEGSFQNALEIDFDPAGNVYMASNNILRQPIPDDERRVPSVTKSSDFGESFTDWDAMPYSVFEDYLVQQGAAEAYPFGNAFFSSFVYQQDGFVVTGEDEYSFLLRVMVSIDNPESYTNFDIVECYKKDGLWGIRNVTRFPDGDLSLPMVIQNMSQVTGATLDSLKWNSFGHEVQAARTADGDYIVCKYVRYTDEMLPLEAPLILAGSGVRYDTIPTTDIFVTVRKLGEETWSEPTNVTNDSDYDKMTFMPRIVPSITQIPIMRNITVDNLNITGDRAGYPNHANQLYPGYPCTLEFDLFSSAVSVEETYDVRNFSLRDVYPNPVEGFAEIGFSNEKPENASLELFNSLGQRVAVLFEGTIEPGFHVKTLNTSNYTPGVYYYTLTIGSQTETKIMNIVR